MGKEDPISKSAFSHDAFISYSRRDRAFAVKLEKALERYKPPRGLDGVPQRRLRVFRDEEDFTGVDYDKAVAHHLEDSRSLVVLCSPAARASQFVDDEIRRFAAEHGSDRIIPLLLSGRPNNEAEEAPEEKAFPEALCELMGMPLAADYLGFDARRNKVDKGAYFGPWSTLLANVYGISRSELEQREKRRRARARRLVAALVTGIIAALSVALVITLMSRQEAVEQRGIAQQRQEEAEEQRDRAERATVAERRAREEEQRQRLLAEERRREAERQTEIARAEAIAARRETANRLAVQTLDELADRPRQALELAIDAVETYRQPGDPTVPRALEALIKATYSFAGGRPVAGGAAGERELVLSDDLWWAASSDGDGTVRFGAAEAVERRALEPPAGLLSGVESWDGRPTELAFAPGRLFALRGVEGGGDEALAAWYWELDDGGVEGAARPIGRLPGRRRTGHDLAASPDGRWISWDDGRTIFLRRAAPGVGQLAERLDGWGTVLSAFSADSRTFVLVEGRRLRRWSLAADDGGVDYGGVDDGGGGDAAVQWVEGGEVEVGIRLPMALAVDPSVENWFWFDLRGTPSDELERVALLGLGGDAEWWDLTTEPPTRHELPNLFDAFTDHLEIYGLEAEKSRLRLRFGVSGEGLLAEAGARSGEFGLAAAHLFERAEEGWLPLSQPNREIGTQERVKRTSGTAFVGPSGGAVVERSGYDVKDPSQLGVARAEWLGPYLLTIGFDGSLLFHDPENGRSALVASEATAAGLAGRLLLVGHRNGKVSLIDVEESDEFEPTFVFSGLDSPVAGISVSLFGRRFAALGAGGEARVWNIRHPSILGEDFGEVSDDWRWLRTDDDDSRHDNVWDLHATDPFARPVAAGVLATAVRSVWDLDTGWLATLHAVDGDETQAAVRLWQLAEAGTLRAPAVDRRFGVPDVSFLRTVDLGLAVGGGEARLSLVGGYPETGRLLDLWSGRERLLGEAGREHDLLVVGPGQRRLVRRRSVEADEEPAAVEVLDLDGWEAAPVVRHTLPSVPGYASAWFSDGGATIVLNRRRFDAATGRELPADDEELGGRRRYGLSRAPGRPPLDVDDSKLWAYDGEEWVELAAGVRSASWQRDGAWLALGGEEGQVWLARPPRGAGLARLRDEVRRAQTGAPLPAPWDARAAGHPITSLAVFADGSRVVAYTYTETGDWEEEMALVWFRTAAGRWDEPLVFTSRDLLRPGNLFSVGDRFRPDGRLALLSDQLVVFDEARLLAEARRLLGGAR